MKIWAGYGSEHSMNLVLIGTFKEQILADTATLIIKKLSDQAQLDDVYNAARALPEDQRFSNKMQELLAQHNMYVLTPTDLEQFVSDHHLDQQGAKITISTDESDVSAFIKIFIEKGARVEVYSAHDYPAADTKN